MNFGFNRDLLVELFCKLDNRGMGATVARK